MTHNEFARSFGFVSYEKLVSASESIVTESDIDWFITQLPDGRWAAWDDAEIALDRVSYFDTREEAVRYHIRAYIDAHARWEREERPSWDGLGETAVAHYLTVEIGGRTYHAQIAQAETGECAVALQTDNPRFEGQWSFLVNFEPASSPEEAGAMVIAAIAKSIAGDRA